MMRSKLAITALPEVLQVLEHNGIDVKRVVDVSLHHSPKDGLTEITVTMLALGPEEQDR